MLHFGVDMGRFQVREAGITNFEVVPDTDKGRGYGIQFFQHKEIDR